MEFLVFKPGQNKQQKIQTNVIYYFEIRALLGDQSVRPTSLVRSMFSLPLVQSRFYLTTENLGLDVLKILVKITYSLLLARFSSYLAAFE